MGKFIHSFRCFAGRFKLIASLLALFLSGALFSTGFCAWYYNTAIDKINAMHVVQVSALRNDLNQSRNINRQILDNLTSQVGVAIHMLKEATANAKSAAHTADRAAEKASRAAKNAANANIRVLKVVPKEPVKLGH